MKNSRLRLLALVVVLGSVAAVYHGVAFRALVVETEASFPIDLRLRWIEQRFFYQGLNPHEYGYPEEDIPASHRGIRGGYPPWSYAIGSAMVPPLDWPATRRYFAVWNVLALGVIVVYGYRASGAASAMQGSVGAVSLLALFPFTICISYGQYSVVVLALLIGCLWAYETGKSWLGGLCLGLAMVKPQLSALFFLAMLIAGGARGLRVVATAIGIVAGASAVAGLVVGQNPVTMLLRAQADSGLYYRLSHNPLLPWLADAIGFGPATTVLAGGGILFAAALVAVLRTRCTMLTLFSLCSVIAMFWSYRKHYDTVLLALPLLNLYILALSRGAVAMWAGFFAVGFSLWVPIRDVQWHWPVVQIGHLVVWSVVLAILLREGMRSPLPGARRAIQS